MESKKISIIGVPMDLGQARRGVDMGPSAIRYAGVVDRLESLNYELDDLGDIQIGSPERTTEEPVDNLRNLKEVADASEKLADAVDQTISANRFPLVLGGDHSIAIGTLAGVARHYKNLGVIWYDAHGDLNTAETSFMVCHSQLA